MKLETDVKLGKAQIEFGDLPALAKRGTSCRLSSSRLPFFLHFLNTFDVSPAMDKFRPRPRCG